MEDSDILDRIGKLVEQEHDLRAKHERGETAPDDARNLDDLEVMLDQCWDLLRQRRAAREYGEDPDVAGARPAKVVENYEQ
jgi:hypothetical protein